MRLDALKATTGHYGTVTQGIWKSNGSEVAVKEIDKAKYSSLVALRNEVRIMQVRGNCARAALELSQPEDVVSRLSSTPILSIWWTCSKQSSTCTWYSCSAEAASAGQLA